MSRLHKETNFESEICVHLTGHGWDYAEVDYARYDRRLALFTPDVLAWAQETQPEARGNLAKNPGAGSEATLLDRLRAQLNQRGALITEAQRAIDILQEHPTALVSAALTVQIDISPVTPAESR